MNQVERKINKRVDYSRSVWGNTLSWSDFDGIVPHYFSESNRRFFKSKRYAEPRWSDSAQAFCFVSSEKHESRWSNINEPRMYTVRGINLDGEILTFGEFQEYKTLKQAEKALSVLINGK